MSSKTDSPCVRICKLDADAAYCVGCGRSLAEIAAWPRASAKERMAILAAAAKRPMLNPPRTSRRGRR